MSSVDNGTLKLFSFKLSKLFLRTNTLLSANSNKENFKIFLLKSHMFKFLIFGKADQRIKNYSWNVPQLLKEEKVLFFVSKWEYLKILMDI